MIDQLLFVPALIGLVVFVAFGTLLPCAAALDGSLSPGHRLWLLLLGIVFLFIASGLRLFLLSIGADV